MSDLLPRLDEFDECLGKHPAVQLLKVLQCTLVIGHNLFGISNAKWNHVGRPAREILAISVLFSQAVVDGRSKRIAFATFDLTRGCVGCLYIFVLVYIGLGV